MLVEILSRIFYLVFIYPFSFLQPRLNSEKKIVIVGSGFSGLIAAVKLQKAGYTKIKIIEANHQIGGTWLVNKFPGVACDVTSHFYCPSFYLNSNWSKAFAPGPEILKYMIDMAKHFDLYKLIDFNTKVTNCEWNDNSKIWTVHAEDVISKARKQFSCDYLIPATGPLRKPLWPEFKNSKAFEGKVMHTALWDEDYDISNKKVAVIGTGATAVQVVPGISKTVKSLKVFQRSPAWVPPRYGFVYGRKMKAALKYIPGFLWIYRICKYLYIEMGYWLLIKEGNLRDKTVKVMHHVHKSRMRRKPELTKTMTPTYPLGCKRMTPSDTYFKAICQENVDVISDRIEEFSANGIKTKDGTEHEFDCIIYATGYDVMAGMKEMKIKGRNGYDLCRQFDENGAFTYLGTCVPNFPNCFFITGPGTGLGHNSILLMMESQVDFIIFLEGN